MAEKSTPNTTMEEFDKLLEDKDFRQLFDLSRHETPGSASEIASSAITTPDPLNMAFINETDVDEQYSQSHSSQQQSQTTKETSSIIHGLIDTIIEQEHEILDLSMPKTLTIKSTSTMPKTPTRVSTGIMPKTPTMVSTGTMPKTPTTVDLVSPATETIDLCSPDTPTNRGRANSTPNMAPQ